MNKLKNWDEEEFILALYLYFKKRPNPPGPNDLEVVWLSFILRTRAIIKGKKISSKFRNTAGVSMQLQNIRKIDNNFKGVGLRPTSLIGRRMWKRYNSNSGRLKRHVKRILDEIESKIDNYATKKI